MAMKSAQLSLLLGEKDENCIQTCNNHNMTCMNSLRSIFDTCDYHTNLINCTSCVENNIAGVKVSHESSTICTKLNGVNIGLNNMLPNCKSYELGLKPVCACVRSN